jgi:hypothetical protein
MSRASRRSVQQRVSGPSWINAATAIGKATEMPLSNARETAHMRNFRVGPAAGERLKSRSVRVTIQQPRHSVSDSTRHGPL